MPRKSAKKHPLYTYPAMNGRSLFRTWFACLKCNTIYCYIIEPPLTLHDILKALPCPSRSPIHLRSEITLLSESDAIELLRSQYETVEERMAA